MIRNIYSKFNRIQGKNLPFPIFAYNNATISFNKIQKFNFLFKKQEKPADSTEIQEEIIATSETSSEAPNTLRENPKNETRMNVDGIEISADDILRNRYKVSIKNSSTTQDAISLIDTKSIVEQYSSLFSSWLIQRVKEGKGTNFSFEELPEEIQSNPSLSSIKGAYGQKEKYVSLDKSEYSIKYQEKMNQKGFITNQELAEIENIPPFIHRSKFIYNDPVEAVREIKKFSKEMPESIIKLQLVMNLDFDRSDHFIQTLHKLPFESSILKQDICVITSEENQQQALSLGAAASITAPKLASLLEEKLFSHKKIICTEEQYVDLLDNCSENLKIAGLEIPMRELGTVLKVEDLPTALKFIQSGSVNLRPVKLQSQYVVEGFDKIIDIDIADTSMNEQQIIANLDSVLRKLSDMQPKSILGRYFLSGIMIVKSKPFVIQAKTLDARFDSYFIQKEEKIVKKKKIEVRETKNSKQKNTKEGKKVENIKSEKKQSEKASK